MPAGPLVTAFSDRAWDAPDRVAIIGAGGVWTYGELAAAVDRASGGLARHGVGPGSVVGLALGRTVEHVVHLLATLRRGARALPLDATLPPGRVADLLAAASAKVVVGRGGLPPERLEGPDDGQSAPGSVLLFTSGSTGTPRGVIVPEVARAERQAWTERSFPAGIGARHLFKSAVGVSTALREIFWPLTTGGAIVLAEGESAREPLALIDLLRRHAVTHLNLTPTLGRLLLETGALPAARSLRHVFLTGEPVGVGLLEGLRARLEQVRITSFYGSTEAPTATVWDWPVGAPRPAPGLGVPAGVPVLLSDDGVVHLGGPGLAAGYLDGDDTRFVGLAGVGRTFRTGDVARWLPDGSLELLGREDRQLKLDGHRVHPEEIERAILAHPGVTHAAVDLRRLGARDRLVAWYVRRPDAPPLDRGALAARLPPALVPGLVVPVTDPPLTTSGKLDRTRLPEPVGTAAEPPQGADEATIAEEFAAVLGQYPGRHESFFALGGTSVDALDVLTRLERRGVVRSLAAFFAAPTPAALAVAAPAPPAARLLRAGHAPVLVCLHPAGGEVVSYLPLIGALPPGPAVIGVRDPRLDGGVPERSVAEQADLYVQALAGVERPWLLGYSYGGLLAWEIGARLVAAGARPRGVLLVDTRFPEPGARGDPLSGLLTLLAELDLPTDAPERVRVGEWWARATRLAAELQPGVRPTLALRNVLLQFGLQPDDLMGDPHARHTRLRVLQANTRAARRVVLSDPPGEVTLVEGAGSGRAEPWVQRYGDRIHVRVIPASHLTVFAREGVAALAHVVTACVSPERWSLR